MLKNKKDMESAKNGVGLIIGYIRGRYPHSRLLCIWFLPVFGNEIIVWDPDFEGDLNV